MKTKTFDCVELKHQAQARRRREMAGMTDEERREHYRRAHEALVQLQTDLRERSAA
jgi:hypothetical protein